MAAQKSGIANRNSLVVAESRCVRRPSGELRTIGSQPRKAVVLQVGTQEEMMARIPRHVVVEFQNIGVQLGRSRRTEGEAAKVESVSHYIRIRVWILIKNRQDRRIYSWSQRAGSAWATVGVQSCQVRRL